jgi:hypothetical protein
MMECIASILNFTSRKGMKMIGGAGGGLRDAVVLVVRGGRTMVRR